MIGGLDCSTTLTHWILTLFCTKNLSHTSSLSLSLCVTPRSDGYGDVTATYIRRSEIPSRIYTKYQCMQESECGSTVVVYIPTEKYKHMVITERYNIIAILHHQKNTKVQYMKRYTKLRDAHEQQKGSREPNRRRTGRKSCGDGSNFCCTPIITEGSAAYSDQLQ